MNFQPSCHPCFSQLFSENSVAITFDPKLPKIVVHLDEIVVMMLMMMESRPMDHDHDRLCCIGHLWNSFWTHHRPENNIL